MKIDHEIFPTVIFSLFPDLKGSCQFLVKVCAQVLVNGLEDLACRGKVWLYKWTSPT